MKITEFKKIKNKLLIVFTQHYLLESLQALKLLCSSNERKEAENAVTFTINLLSKINNAKRMKELDSLFLREFGYNTAIDFLDEVNYVIKECVP